MIDAIREALKDVESQKQLAYQIGMDASELSRILSGQLGITLEKCAKLLKTLHIKSVYEGKKKNNLKSRLILDQAEYILELSRELESKKSEGDMAQAVGIK